MELKLDLESVRGMEGDGDEGLGFEGFWVGS